MARFLHSFLCRGLWSFWQSTLQYLTSLQAVHFFNLMSPHSVLPQEAHTSSSASLVVVLMMVCPCWRYFFGFDQLVSSTTSIINHSLLGARSGLWGEVTCAWPIEKRGERICRNQAPPIEKIRPASDDPPKSRYPRGGFFFKRPLLFNFSLRSPTTRHPPVSSTKRWWPWRPY